MRLRLADFWPARHDGQYHDRVRHAVPGVAGILPTPRRVRRRRARTALHAARRARVALLPYVGRRPR